MDNDDDITRLAELNVLFPNGVEAAIDELGYEQFIRNSIREGESLESLSEALRDLGIRGISQEQFQGLAPIYSAAYQQAATRLGFTPGDLFTGVVQIDLSESLDFPDIRVIREAALENDVPQVEVLTGRIINGRLESFLRARAADGLDFHGGVVEYLGDVDGLPTFSILY